MEGVEQKELDFQLKLSHFTRSLKRSQITEFAEVLSMIENLYITNNGKQSNPHFKLPTSVADIRRNYTEGTYSITSTVPTPTCHFEKDHSFITIRDCINDTLLCKKSSILHLQEWDSVISDKNKSVDNIFQCRAVQRIIENCKVNHTILCIIL